MKKITSGPISALLCLTVVLMLCACGLSEKTEPTQPAKPASEAASQSEEPSTEPELSEADKLTREGVELYFGLGDEGVNIDKAVEKFEIAAAEGSGYAMYCLGRYYANNSSEEDHYLRAIDLYQDAADVGCPLGLVGLGILTYNGDGVEPDIRKATAMFAEAAAEGCPEAYCLIGEIFQMSLGERPTPDNIALVRDYYELAMQGEDPGWLDEIELMMQNLAKIEEEANEPEIEITFPDVDHEAYYFDAVKWAVRNEISLGLSDGTFGIGKNCLRKDAIVFLWRMVGRPEPTEETDFNDISDIKKDSNFYKAIAWADEKDISGAGSDGGFHPNDPVKLREVMVFLYRLAGKPSYTITTKYDDIGSKEGSIQYDALYWALENGIIYPYSDNTVRPLGECTREQVITFLYRYSQLY